MVKCKDCPNLKKCAFMEALLDMADEQIAEMKQWRKDHADLFAPKPCLNCKKPIKHGAFCSDSCEREYRGQ